MPEIEKHLAVIDLPGIKDFVFGAGRLVEIRGASGLLDHLNRNEIPDLLRGKLGADHVECVFAGGGAGQFILEADTPAIQEALTAANGLVFAESGGALRLSWGLAPLSEAYPETLKAAFLDLDRQKNERPFHASSPLHAGFVRQCDSCAGMASDFSVFGGEERLLCKACLKKENFGRKRGLWRDFAKYLRQEGMDAESARELRPQDFDEIGKRSARNGYTALVYADGNSMGKIVKSIHSKQEFRDFSFSVDAAIREACYEAIACCCPPVRDKIPADILLLGGDDLLVYLAAETAFPFALEAARRFQEKTREKLAASDSATAFQPWIDGDGLTISFGIAFGKSHTPISILLEQAEELMTSAKRKGLETRPNDLVAPAFLDFHLTTRFNQVGVSETRRTHLALKTAAGEDLRLHQGPYALPDARDMWRHAERLASSEIPRSRLHRLGMAPFRGKADGTVETLIQYGRAKAGEQRQLIAEALKRFDCLENMPWRPVKEGHTTALVELIELAEFTRG
jgi:hypothetical protein